MIYKPESALVIVGHGSTVNADSSAPTRQWAAALRERKIFGEVHCCFRKEEPNMETILDTVEHEDIYIVPNFISEAYFTQIVLPQKMRLDGAITRRGNQVIKYCVPVGAHASMTQLLLKRAREIADAPETETTLLIVAHGTERHGDSAVAAREQAQRLAATTRYAAVRSAYIEEAPFIADWAAFTDTPNVIVVPFFISDGLHTQQDIPALLGIENMGNPHHTQGRTLYYSRAIGTDPMIAEVILAQVKAFDAAHAEALL